MFAMFVINPMGTSFFGEHGWRTWERLRAAPATSLELMAGKALPVFAVLGAQSALILGVGLTALQVPVRGSPLALAAVVIAYQLSVLALGLCLIALSRTRGQLGVLADSGGMLFACMGGALVPAAALPGWAGAVAPVFPSHWAMRGITATIDGRGLGGAATSVALLLAFAGAFLAVAAARFAAARVDRRERLDAQHVRQGLCSCDSCLLCSCAVGGRGAWTVPRTSSCATV